MTGNVYNEENHQYGLWYTNDLNQCCRDCLNPGCGYTEVLPKDDDKDSELRKQKEASIFFKAFQNVSNEDENLIVYLNLILSDYVNYLDLESLSALTNRMHHITKYLETIDVHSSRYVYTLREQFISKNMESFYDTLEEFQNYNQNSLFTKQEMSPGRTH